MPDTYTLLEKITVGAAGAANVEFVNIPQTYTDLVILHSTRSDYNGVNASIYVAPNSATTNLSSRSLQGSSTAVASATYTSILGRDTSAKTSTTSTFGNGSIYIPNYTSSDFKSISLDTVGENNASSAAYLRGIQAGLWSSTAAITSIKITTDGNFVQYSTFYLYGVAKLGVTPSSAPKATGGDIIVSDGTYWIHTFLSSGVFTPKTSLSCDYLVVAGGGGGGNDYYISPGRASGGGGAGGLRSTVTATGGGGSLESALSLVANTGYTVTIGAGGAGGTNSTDNGSAGSNSVFSTITSTGGGGGGSHTASLNRNGVTGGSGGGGSNSASGGAGTTNQGYAGGAGGAVGSGGGGGAGAIGVAGGSANCGSGGAGVATSISGSSVTYAGGGGGGGSSTYVSGSVGAGGSGGGGSGAKDVVGVAGTANTGGGGGGGRNTSGTGGGAGGSGIVIVRYTIA